jgi:hypothetical protein
MGIDQRAASFMSGMRMVLPARMALNAVIPKKKGESNSLMI